MRITQASKIMHCGSAACCTSPAPELARISHHPPRQLPEASDRRYVGSGRRIALHCSTPKRRTAGPPDRNAASRYISVVVRRWEIGPFSHPPRYDPLSPPGCRPAGPTTSRFVGFAGFLPLLVSPDNISCNQHQVDHETNRKKSDRRFVLRRCWVDFRLFTVAGLFITHSN